MASTLPVSTSTSTSVPVPAPVPAPVPVPVPAVQELNLAVLCAEADQADRADGGRKHNLILNLEPGHPLRGDLEVFHKGERLTISVLAIGPTGEVRVMVRSRRSFVVWRREVLARWSPSTRRP